MIRPQGAKIIPKRSALAEGRRPLVFLVFWWLLIVPLLLTACGKKEEKPKWEIEKNYRRGPVEVTVRISKSSITIAERVTLEIDALVQANVDVDLPRFGEKLEQFSIAEYSAPPSELSSDSRVRTRRSYILEPFLSGDYRIPPLTIRFKEKGGSAGDGHEVQTDGFTVRVKSLLPEDVKKLEIKDIAEPVDLPLRINPWLLWGGLAAFLAASGVGTWLLLRKRRQREERLRRIPAHEIAYLELEKILAENLIEKGEIKEFYNRVSAVLRHYIENRFGLRAPERTTEEFLVEAERSDALEKMWKEILTKYLSHCDLVKFAQHQPSNEEIQRTFDTCKDFIEATKEEKTAGNQDDKNTGEEVA